MRAQQPLLCPSAQPDMPGAVIHGVVDAASGKILHLERPVPVTQELLAATAPLLPSEVLRFSAECQTHRCGHYTGASCSLVERLVNILPAASVDLPGCAIRSTCRWFSQRGRFACVRCNDIVTDQFMRNETLTAVAQLPVQAAIA